MLSSAQVDKRLNNNFSFRFWSSVDRQTTNFEWDRNKKNIAETFCIVDGAIHRWGSRTEDMMPIHDTLEGYLGSYSIGFRYIHFYVEQFNDHIHKQTSNSLSRVCLIYIFDLL